MNKFYKSILIIAFLISFLNLLYAFGYQGVPMSQFEFLGRILGSVLIGGTSILLLITKFDW